MKLTAPLFFLTAVLSAGFGSSRVMSQTEAAPFALAEPVKGKVFNVRDFGAKGDGAAKDTVALQKALDACVAAGGGEVLVPAGNYLTGSLVLGGRTTLRFEPGATLTGSPDVADYPFVQARWEGEFRPSHRALLSAEKADHVSIVGPGTLVGPPLALAQLRPRGPGTGRGPVIIEAAECKDLLIEGITVHYQRLWSVHPMLCERVAIRGVTIRSSLSNGDGLDIDSCKDVLVEKCDIDGGDDAISLKSGRGLAAMNLHRPTENVLIRDSILRSSRFAAIGLGTEMSGGIRHVRIERCTLSGVENCIYIKSRDGRGGYMEDISGDHLIVETSPTFIGIDLMTKGIQASDPVTGIPDKWARVQNLKFTHIQVNDVANLVLGKSISAERPIDGFVLSEITGTCRRGITLANVVNADFSALNVSGFTGPLLTLTNVTGRGLEKPPQK
jgi:hypothetical protein